MSNSPMITDRALVDKIISGDMQAFKLLIKQNERLVAHMVSRLVDNPEDREELCQDVFLKVYQKLSGFNFQSKLSTWIATIAYRHSVNYLKKKKIPIEGDIEQEEFQSRTHFVVHENPENLFSNKDLKDFMVQMVDKLPVQYKTVVTLFHLEGMKLPEIEQVTELPVNTIKSHLFRARKLLKEKLKLYLVKEELL
ncbi:sigma-70 family RNA polymerase sigma factor [Fulvivirgaceae bacterium BMA10]|uniref:Sigma-70 family RNA polymerase sigma factor n=1 Tax=Splendidivirga corallicola TaxID=3051826 RepID=A0ABT8KIU4_9BACT|nr:sigma-70 family RNA polymerase sigma factor [Fulvivirgaceae bacterium BMA10]